MQQITIQDLAARFGVQERAIKDFLRGRGLEFCEANYIAIAQAYAQPNPKRSEQQLEAARTWLVELQNASSPQQAIQQQTAVTVNITNTASQPAPEQAETVGAGDGAQGSQRPAFNVALGIVYACMFAWQVTHTAILEHSVSLVAGGWGVALAVFLGVGIQCAALLLTINYSRLAFLVAAAAIEFCINILVYFPHETLAKILLCAVAALSLFAYAEMLTKKR